MLYVNHRMAYYMLISGPLTMKGFAQVSKNTTVVQKLHVTNQGEGLWMAM